MDALGDWGKKRTDDAISAETTKITVVKNPKTFCVRTRVEYIFFFSLMELFGGGRFGEKESGLIGRRGLRFRITSVR